MTVFSIDRLPKKSVLSYFILVSSLTINARSEKAISSALSEAASLEGLSTVEAKAGTKEDWVNAVCNTYKSNARRKSSSIKNSSSRKSVEQRDEQEITAFKEAVMMLSDEQFQKVKTLFEFYKLEGSLSRVGEAKRVLDDLSTNLDIMFELVKTLKIPVKQPGSAGIELQDMPKTTFETLVSFNRDDLLSIRNNIPVFQLIEKIELNKFDGTPNNGVYKLVLYRKLLPLAGNDQALKKISDILNYAFGSGMSYVCLPALVDACLETKPEKLTSDVLDYLIKIRSVFDINVDQGRGGVKDDIKTIEDNINKKSELASKIMFIAIDSYADSQKGDEIKSIIDKYMAMKNIDATWNINDLGMLITLYSKTQKDLLLKEIMIADAAIEKASKCMGMLCSKEKGIDAAIRNLSDKLKMMIDQAKFKL
ncbi:MAG: hypothetical protein Q8S21_04360 [Candidatus Paracaedibacteraceae bacterium]|nr:hypothetical protein [Candidatus Paracaedibacteraceae bacterium]